MPADPSPRPLIPAIGYVRVSWAREEMISPQTQRAAVLACAARKGYAVTGWAEDLDMTGMNFKRKIMAVIERVKAGEAQAIIAWKYSRFGRDRLGNAVNIAALEAAGGELVSATEEVDASTATGRFQRGILLEVAAFEAERAGETWAETYAWRIREGLPPFGRPRFGYRREGRVRDEDDPQRTRHVRGEREAYVPDPAAGSLALAAGYGAYAAGAGFHVIAGRWNGDGWRTAYGNRWRDSAAKDVLDSGFGAGLIQVHSPACECRAPRTKCRKRVYVPGAHEAVIGWPEWESYLDRRAEVSATPPRLRSAAYAMTGLARCGHCRSAMVPSGRTSSGMAIFSCSYARRYGAGCDGYPSLGVDRIEAAVREKVAEWAEDVDAAARDAARQAGARDGAIAVARLEEIVAGHDRRLVNLALQRASEAGAVLGDETWRAAAAKARADRDEAAADLEAARREAARGPRPDAGPVMKSLMRDWDTLPPASLNQILKALVRRVAVSRTAEKVRDDKGWWRRMPASFDVMPVWEPDPWEGDMPMQGKSTQTKKDCGPEMRAKRSCPELAGHAGSFR